MQTDPSHSPSAQVEGGSVVGLWRYPVKSMLGEELNASEITECGLVGDRDLVSSALGAFVTFTDPEDPSTARVDYQNARHALQVFDHILLMTAGGPENATNVLVYYIYRQAFQFFQIGYASALAVLLFFVALGLTMGQWLLRGRSADA